MPIELDVSRTVSDEGLSSVGTAAGSSPSSGISAWGSLANKPTVLTPPGFNAGDFPSAEQLASADIASALSHDPGLDGGIQTTVRASATDDALVTEQAVATLTSDDIGSRIEGLSINLASLEAEVQTHNAALQIVVPEARKVIGGQGIQAIGDLSEDRTVAVNSTVARTDRVEEFTEKVVFLGDVVTKGNVFETQAETVKITDNLAVINNGEPGAGVTEGFAGWEVDRGLLDNFEFGFDEDRERFVVGKSEEAKQVVATREDSPNPEGIPYWNDDKHRFDTTDALRWVNSSVELAGGIGHPEFVSERQKWFITEEGVGDFRALLADELRVDRFLAEVNEALAGEDFLTKSFAKLDADFAVPASSPVGKTRPLTVQNLPGLPKSAVFEDGDTIRLRYANRGEGLTVGDVWVKVTKPSSFDPATGGTQTWDAEILAAGEDIDLSDVDVPTGSIALDYGDPETGGYLIERSVLDPARTGEIAPYDRILKWEDTTGDRIPDDYTVLNLRGNLGGLPKAKGSGPGIYSEQARFTEDLIVGNLDAATSTAEGDYLQYGSEGFELRIGGTTIRAMQDSIELLAERIVQEQESRAGLEITASETEAEVRAQAEIIGDDFSSDATISAFADETRSRFDASVQYTKDGEVGGEAKINLKAGPNGSSAVLAAEDVRISGNTTFFGGSGIPGGVLEDDYTEKGTENVTIRGSGEPNSTTTRPFDSDGDGTNDDPIDGDFYIDTNDGDKPYVYDGPNDQWEAAYTNIDGGDITTGTISLNRIDFTVENGKIAAEDLAITASDLTISGSSKSDVKNAVLQLEDDVRLLAENLTQEKESRASLELTASKTESRFEADVKFAGNTAAISLLANDDGSSARLAGDSITLDGDTIVDGTLAVTDNATTDNNELQLDPSTPAERIVESGDTVAVFTAETNPSYSPTQTSDVLDISPDSTGVNSYTLSGTGLWLSFSADVTNGASDSQTVGAELRDANTGNVVADPTSIASSGEQVSVGAVVQVGGLTSIEVERINTSATLDKVSVEVYKPLTVISREGVKVYKTPNSVKTLT